MKALLAVTAAMTLFTSAASAAPATAVTTRPRVVTCGTMGDAFGGLSLSFATVNQAVIKETTMAGKTVIYRSQTSPEIWAAYNAGRDVSLVWWAANANMFGGAISNATILTLHTRVGTKSKGFLSRGGTVFYLDCRQ